ncbi:MAG: hypothetical protein ACT4OX_07965 [Actinomycetota bacterium]
MTVPTSPTTAFAALAAGVALPEFRATVSAVANERYWRAAGLDHPRLAAGALYPLIAANLTILAFQQRCPEAMIQTRQYLRCHRGASADRELVVTGTVTDRYSKRGREYVDVRAVIATADDPGSPLWTSDVTFTPAATLGAS